jgi:hypothetical protein
METLLTITGMGFPPLSARGCVQELRPVQQTNFKRNIYGDLVQLGQDFLLKYQTTIHCEDKTTLTTDGLIPGNIVDVACIQQLWEKIPENSREIKLSRSPVNDSITCLNHQQEIIPIDGVDGTRVTLSTTQNSPSFITYRPLLRMMVKDFKLNTNEWGMICGWRVDLEEV